jgi:hypothetical protein
MNTHVNTHVGLCGALLEAERISEERAIPQTFQIVGFAFLHSRSLAVPQDSQTLYPDRS